jgi:Protein of unknown function (DUF4232)
VNRFLASFCAWRGQHPNARRALAGLAVTAAIAGGSNAPSQAQASRVVKACRTIDLRLTAHFVQGAAGNQLYAIILTKRGTGRCFVKGFPGVSLLNAQRHQTGRAATRDHVGVIKAVVLAPRSSAVAQLSEAEEACKTAINQSVCARVSPRPTREPRYEAASAGVQGLHHPARQGCEQPELTPLTRSAATGCPTHWCDLRP